MAKLLTGLYQPTEGTIRYNGVTVEPGNARWYQGKIAAVFSESHAFDGIADPQRDDLDEESEELAIRLRLQTWVQALGARETQGAGERLGEASAGERRRIALLLAAMENRSVMLLDEWAADQDVGSKDYFYRELLPHLKSLGKLVIVVSHDRHFLNNVCTHIADIELARRKPQGLPRTAKERYHGCSDSSPRRRDRHMACRASSGASSNGPAWL